MRRRLRALSERNARALDRALVVFLAGVVIIDLSTNSKVEGPLWLNFVVMLGIALSFLWRRSQPLVTVVATVSGLVLTSLWLTKPPDTFAAVVLMVSAAYAAGRHLHGRQSIYTLGLGTVAIVALAVSLDPHDIFFPVTFFWILPWLAGRTIRNHTMLARELAEKAERAQHAREEDERRAIALERSRIARELHDVLAHNLSVMVVQASAARRVLDKDPVKAVEAASLIERTGREALAEIRHLFGPVRRGDGEALSGPPSIARVDDLARRARAAGLRVELRVSGDPVELPAGIDLTAYRIVQEALTNARKHACPARAQVTIRYAHDALDLEITNDGRRVGNGEGPGHGLVGMRERVALYGGELEAAPRAGGGYVVRARLPVEAEPA
jgi:signal transduction histidine kinase